MLMVLRDSEGNLVKLGQYTIIKRLSKSSFGNIYLSKDKKNENYVVKEYHNFRNISRLKTEIKILNLLNKANSSVKLHGYKKIGKKFYTVSDYADGGDLEDYIESKKRLSEEESINILKEILETLQLAHNNNIIHYDIKAENVFVKGDSFLLSDWGVSKVGKELPVLNINGDDNYVAPEVYKNGIFDKKYDIYSLGCTLYHMVTGKEVFGFNRDTLLVEKIYSHTSIDLPYPEYLSTKMKFLISRMVEKDHKKRVDIDEIFEILDDKINIEFEEKSSLVSNDFNERAKYYIELAKKNYIYAQNILALMYEEGNHVKQDFKKALYWYERSAGSGLAKAQNNLALSYLEGDIVKQDFKKAFYWFEKAASKGFNKSLYNLGEMYYKGEYVKKDFDLAKKYYQKAAYLGSKKAYTALEEKFNIKKFNFSF